MINLLWVLIFILFPTLAESTILTARISCTAANHKEDNPSNKIQPGTPMLLKATVKNIGTQTSAPGEILIRFMFCNPLENAPQSVLFETETLTLPSILAGESVIFSFKKPHTWPSIFDFIRQDWGMRQYQVIVKYPTEDYVIGIMPIGLSAHYYEGAIREIPKNIPPSPDYP